MRIADLSRTAAVECVRPELDLFSGFRGHGNAFSDGQVTLEAGQGDDAQASEALAASLVGEDITIALPFICALSTTP